MTGGVGDDETSEPPRGEMCDDRTDQYQILSLRMNERRNSR